MAHLHPYQGKSKDKHMKTILQLQEIPFAGGNVQQMKHATMCSTSSLRCGLTHAN